MAISYTVYLSLGKHAAGDYSWHTVVNNNFDAIDTAVGAQHTASGTHTNITAQTLNVSGLTTLAGGVSGSIEMQPNETVDGVDISDHVSDANAHHAQVHIIGSHDTDATGAQLDVLVGGYPADSYHTHSNTYYTKALVGSTASGSSGASLVGVYDGLDNFTGADVQSVLESIDGYITSASGVVPHTISSHIDTDATGADLNALTDGSNVDILHGHDHGALTGLSDDDHPQYLLANGSRAVTGSFTINGPTLTVSGTTVAGTQVATLINGSNADSLHTHTGSGFYDTVTVTGTTTLDLSNEIVFCNASSGSFYVYLPTASGIAGKRYEVKKVDSSVNVVTIAPFGAELVDGDLTVDLINQYDNLSVVSGGTRWYIL